MRNRAASPQTQRLCRALMCDPAGWQYGYELSKMTGLSSGTLYPLLIRLHERGLLEARWVEPARPGRPARHAYRLTPGGMAFTRQFAPDEERSVLGTEAIA